MKNKLLPVSTVAGRLGISAQSVYNLIESGDLPATRIGPRAGIRISEFDLDKFLEIREKEISQIIKKSQISQILNTGG